MRNALKRLWCWLFHFDYRLRSEHSNTTYCWRCHEEFDDWF
jgi:hypothetical protein